MVKIKPAIFLISFVLLLTGCTSQQQSNSRVDNISLLRSMTYTHRHLLDIELASSPQEEKVRYDSLLQSHCDLIDRNFVNVNNGSPDQCQILAQANTQQCTTRFHRCVGSCPSYKDNCTSCEEQLQSCLYNEAEGQKISFTKPAHWMKAHKRLGHWNEWIYWCKRFYGITANKPGTYTRKY